MQAVADALVGLKGEERRGADVVVAERHRSVLQSWEGRPKCRAAAARCQPHQGHQAIRPAICVSPDATDRRSEPVASRAAGAARAIAARTAGTRLEPPVRKIVSIAAPSSAAAAM